MSELTPTPDRTAADLPAAELPGAGLAAKVLTASDGVVHGTRVDRSGEVLETILRRAGFEVVDRRVVADGVESVGGALRAMADGGDARRR